MFGVCLDYVCVGGGVLVCGMVGFVNIASRSGGRSLEETNIYQRNIFSYIWLRKVSGATLCFELLLSYRPNYALLSLTSWSLA